MTTINTRWALSFAAAICLAALTGQINVFAQQTSADDVVRTNTELVQSAVTVLDKSGHFVAGLSRDQFEVLIDGKLRPLSFFEQITAGSARERQVLLANNSSEAKAPMAPARTIVGRTIVFFIDDNHLSLDSLNRTRQMLRHFIENEMNSTDRVAIASASGQIGFLEQFTNNKAVLDAAVARLTPRPYTNEGYGVGTTKMTEYMALAIDSSRDDKVFTFYVEECIKSAGTKNRKPGSPTRMACETQVKNSARAVLTQAGQITMNTYNSLQSLMQSSARTPGRKLAYFVSDGFLFDAGPRASAVRDKLENVIDTARRSGVVIYSIHATGLVNSNFADPANSRPMDPNGRLDLASVGEVQSTQDALNALARDTGGRALRNTNYFERWVSATLDETSNYYLLAWRPENDFEKAKKFRNVKIGIIGRPDLTVRAPSGYVEKPKTETIAVKAQTATPSTPENQLRDALADYHPADGLQLQLGLTYLSTPNNGLVVASSIQIGESGISYGDDNSPATIRLAGVVLNDKGKIASSFSNQLNVKPLKTERTDGGVFYTQHSPLAPGTYQVRVAARDEKSSRVGSAMQWIVVPDLKKAQLTMSSVLLDGQVFHNASNANGTGQVQLSVDHTFARESKLSYWLFIYNAKRDGNGKPHLTIQTTIAQGGQTILTITERRLDSAGEDPDRIPFGEQVPLKTLSPGRYDLQITINDSVARTTAVQNDYFVVR